jgi:YgiT-type zinc finger domain-containing protein
MKCIVCKQAETSAGTTTVTLDRQGATFVFKDVPAQVCPNCGEDYLDDTVSSSLLQSADAMVAAGTQVEIRRYAATA